MARGWNPAAHPRDHRGRWKSKGSAGSSGGQSSPVAGKKVNREGNGFSFPGGPGTITVRASLRSGTVQYGKTFPLIPGKANIYIGGLVRLEKAGNKPSFLEKKRNEAVDKILTRIPQSRAGKAASDILRNGQTQVGGVTVGKSGGKRRASSIRVSNSKQAMAGKRVRAGRKPRKPRQPRKRA